MRVTIAVIDTAFRLEEMDVLIVPFYGTEKIWMNETAKQLILQSSGQDTLRRLAASINTAMVLQGGFISFSKEKLLCYHDDLAHSARMIIPIVLREAQFRKLHHIVIPLLRFHLLGLADAAEDMIAGLKQFFHFVQEDITVTVALGCSEIRCFDFLQTQAEHINKAKKPRCRMDDFWKKEAWD